MRVDADVRDAFKATGPGWQTRNNALQQERGSYILFTCIEMSFNTDFRGKVNPSATYRRTVASRVTMAWANAFLHTMTS
jgi:hypothetical protein